MPWCKCFVDTIEDLFFDFKRVRNFPGSIRHGHLQYFTGYSQFAQILNGWLDKCKCTQ